MSAERDELRRLVEELPEEQVLAVIDEVRRRLPPADHDGSWPPAWFGATNVPMSLPAPRNCSLTGSAVRVLRRSDPLLECFPRELGECLAFAFRNLGGAVAHTLGHAEGDLRRRCGVAR